MARSLRSARLQPIGRGGVALTVGAGMLRRLAQPLRQAAVHRLHLVVETMLVALRVCRRDAVCAIVSTLQSWRPAEVLPAGFRS